MKIKSGLKVLVFLFALFLFAKFIPFFWRSAQADILGGDERVINISRPHYLFPREWIGWGGMNLIDFWSHAPDPLFEANKISSFKFVDTDGRVVSAAVQGFQINRIYKNPEFREEIMAIRTPDGIFEYPIPGFQFIGLSEGTSFHLLAQDGDKLFFYYWDSASREDKTNVAPEALTLEALTIPAILIISLPLERGDIQIIKADNADEWGSVLEYLKSQELADGVFERLCSERYTQKGVIIEQLFGAPCQ